MSVQIRNLLIDTIFNDHKIQVDNCIRYNRNETLIAYIYSFTNIFVVLSKNIGCLCIIKSQTKILFKKNFKSQ